MIPLISEPDDFFIEHCSVEFIALDPMGFPRENKTNVLRGSLGYALRHVSASVYSQVFEPRWDKGPRRYGNAPRPFALRWTSEKTLLNPGERFTFEVLLFARRPEWLQPLQDALIELGNTGITKTRSRAQLLSFVPAELPFKLPVQTSTTYDSGRLKVHFVTPTELKTSGAISIRPEFDLLIGRLVGRIRSLGCGYQGWTRDWDGRWLQDLAREVELVDFDWEHAPAERRSSRTQQIHPLGGFVGWAEYRGPITAFAPLLAIGEWTGVGRQTVWGNGVIHIQHLDP